MLTPTGTPRAKSLQLSARSNRWRGPRIRDRSVKKERTVDREESARGEFFFPPLSSHAAPNQSSRIPAARALARVRAATRPSGRIRRRRRRTTQPRPPAATAPSCVRRRHLTPTRIRRRCVLPTCVQQPPLTPLARFAVAVPRRRRRHSNSALAIGGAAAMVRNLSLSRSLCQPLPLRSTLSLSFN